jgi:hypothetical protein
MTFNGTNVPFGATVFATIAFSSSGVLNVILFTLTRPKLLPSRDHGITTLYGTPWQKSTGSRGPLPGDSQPESWEDRVRAHPDLSGKSQAVDLVPLGSAVRRADSRHLHPLRFSVPSSMWAVGDPHSKI